MARSGSQFLRTIRIGAMSLSECFRTCTLAVSACALLVAPVLAAGASVPLPAPNPKRLPAASATTRAPLIALPVRNPGRASQAPAAPATPKVAVTPSEPATPTVAAAPSEAATAPAEAATAPAEAAAAPEEATVTPTDAAAPTEVATAAASDAPPLPVRAPEPPAPPFDYDKALKPLLAYDLSNADRDNLKEAFRASYSSRGSDALAAMRAIKDKSARMLAEWYYLRSNNSGAAPERIEAFRLANPGWPNPDLLRRRAEEALLEQGDAKATRAFFAKSSPATPAGKAALLAAHRQANENGKALQLLRTTWLDPDLDEDTEKHILDKHGDLLTVADKKARIDVLLFQDRKSKLDDAVRLAKLVGPEEERAVSARAAVVRRVKNANKLLDALPEAAQAEIGVRFSRIQWLRRHDHDKEAWELLRAVPNEPTLLLDLDEWWIERRINCRAALDEGQPQIAYEIAKNHGPLTGESYAEAEFLAGWVALRYLNKPETARIHFLALRTAATDSKTIARAEYWLGRTEQVLGRTEEADAHYRNAAQYPFDYYGQLGAHAALRSKKDIPLMVAPTPLPTEADVKRFMARDPVRAIGVLRAADLENIAALFFFELARTLDQPAEIALLAQLARRMDQPQASVRLGKIALNRGLSVVDYAFPTDMLPPYTPLNDGVEESLLFALSRQESEFNPGAKSPAGAHGLLQLMPRTARNIARAYKVRYNVKRLTAEPNFNMMLGAAHLRDLVDEFGGSYAMALAAYNAGGPRVWQWIDQFGDPRSAKMDPIDWVERIPFTETREYVQKILESVQVFRARLAGPEKALQLTSDLNRGRKHPSPETASALD